MPFLPLPTLMKGKTSLLQSTKRKPVDKKITKERGKNVKEHKTVRKPFPIKISNNNKHEIKVPAPKQSQKK